MQELVGAPGVMRKSARLFVIPEDVEIIMGCGKSKAYEIVTEVNNAAKQKGMLKFPAGRANKYLFAKSFGIPIEEVDKVINREGGV